jgi:hypothetical protein
MSRGRDEDAEYRDQMFGQGKSQRPTNAGLQRREASPSELNSSGMERAMGALADKMHKPK